MALPDLTGKTVLITGTSRGIGAGLARACADAGMRVAGCARTNPAEWESPEACEIQAQVDVADEAQVVAFIEQTAVAFGNIDLLVHNAGVLEPIAPLRDLSAEQMRAHLDINFMGSFFATKAYVQHMRGHAYPGVLLHISSGAAWNGYAGWGAYCAGKAALDRLAETAQLEEADASLRVHAIAPGVVDTYMQEQIRASDPAAFPMLDKFLEMKEQDSFNTLPFVAQHLLAIAFDPAARPDEVVCRLPAEMD
ncbi:MAG: SDR family NAD(P)-dependent oxidoreductase [Planctomycetes bacterium]|nr:SDR family NAD(P)-dependent oxidoreductase [Planctomycetota bacterium]